MHCYDSVHDVILTPSPMLYRLFSNAGKLSLSSRIVTVSDETPTFPPPSVARTVREYLDATSLSRRGSPAETLFEVDSWPLVGLTMNCSLPVPDSEKLNIPLVPLSLSEAVIAGDCRKKKKKGTVERDR